MAQPNNLIQEAWDAQDLDTPKKNSSGEALAAGLPTATAVPVLALSLDTFTSVPCTALGARVERPEDVYQIGEQGQGETMQQVGHGEIHPKLSKESLTYKQF